MNSENSFLTELYKNSESFINYSRFNSSSWEDLWEHERKTTYSDILEYIKMREVKLSNKKLERVKRNSLSGKKGKRVVTKMNRILKKVLLKSGG